MAALICWASGLLEVKADKDVPVDGGPVVIMSGMSGKLRQLMTAHAVFNAGGDWQGWCVPGCQDVPTEGREDGAVQQDRMTLVMAFGDRLRRATAKKKGLKYLKEMA